MFANFFRFYDYRQVEHQLRKLDLHLYLSWTWVFFFFLRLESTHFNSTRLTIWHGLPMLQTQNLTHCNMQI